jgi:hypothetical protein
MQKKTVIKRAAKTWPKNERLNMAIQNLNVDLDEGIEFGNTGRTSGADVAGKALEERKAKVRKELLEKLEDIAKLEGEKALNAKIELLNAGQRSVIEDEIPRLQEIAKASDAAIIEGERAGGQQ